MGILKSKSGFTKRDIIVIVVIVVIVVVALIPLVIGLVNSSKRKAVANEAKAAYVSAQIIAKEQSIAGKTEKHIKGLVKNGKMGTPMRKLLSTDAPGVIIDIAFENPTDGASDGKVYSLVYKSLDNHYVTVISGKSTEITKDTVLKAPPK